MFESYQGKRLLLIAPIYFDYEKEIIKELEDVGFLVDWLPDRPFSSQLMRGAATITPSVIQPLVDLMNERLLNELGAPEYEYIFVINGQTISQKFLRQLKIDFPRAKFLLYMWDSFKNRKNSLKNLHFFDSISTFDNEDSKKYGANFRPLFYSRGFKMPSSKNKYDVSFVGTIHSDRYEVLRRFKGQLPKEATFYSYMYLQALWVFYYYKLKIAGMRLASSDEFEYSPLTKQKLYEVFIDSKAILDIEHPKQSGLTMRTFEALGSEKKLITTNKIITQYDFYDSNNICVIDRLNPQLPDTFLSSSYKSLPVEIYNKYSIRGWISELLGLKCKAI